MMEKQYQYDAFISYRHLSPDKPIAERLQKLLESYVPPKGVGPAKRRKLHLFRDETELPTSNNLGDSIRDALDQSRFLIVICSPDLPESKWCREEIKHFKARHDNSNDNILTLMVSRDGSVVFPEELKYETITVTDKTGTHQAVREVEPLAANVCAPTLNQSFKKLKREFLRIAAPLCDCKFDDLYGREQRRKNRRRLIGTVTAVSVLSLIAVASTAALVTINNQKNEIEKSAYELKLDKSHLLENEANLLDKNGEIYEALDAAQEALSIDGIPEQPDVMRIAASLSGAYEKDAFVSVNKIHLQYPAKDICLMNKGTRLMTFSEDGAKLWDTITGKLLQRYSLPYTDMARRKVVFQSDWYTNHTATGLDAIAAAENYVYLVQTSLNKYSVNRIEPVDGSMKWVYIWDKEMQLISGNEKAVVMQDDRDIQILNGDDGSLIAKLEGQTIDLDAGCTAFYQWGYLMITQQDKDGLLLKVYECKDEKANFLFEKKLNGVAGGSCGFSLNKLAKREESLLTMAAFTDEEDGTKSAWFAGYRLPDGEEKWTCSGPQADGKKCFTGSYDVMSTPAALSYAVCGDALILVNQIGETMYTGSLKGSASLVRDSLGEQLYYFTDTTEIGIDLIDYQKDKTPYSYINRGFPIKCRLVSANAGLYAVSDYDNPTDVVIYRTLTNDGAQDTVTPENLDHDIFSFVLSPQKGMIAYCTDKGTETIVGWMGVYGAKCTIPETFIGKNGVDFLADQALLMTQDDAFKVYSVKTGKLIWEDSDHEYRFQPHSVCTEKGLLYVLDQSGTLKCLDFSAGRPTVTEPLATLGIKEIDEFSVSEDGTRAIVNTSESFLPWMIDLETLNAAQASESVYFTPSLNSACVTWTENKSVVSVYQYDINSIFSYDAVTGELIGKLECNSAVLGLINVGEGLCFETNAKELVRVVHDEEGLHEDKVISDYQMDTTGVLHSRYEPLDDGKGLLTNDLMSVIIDPETLEIYADTPAVSSASADGKSIFGISDGKVVSFPILSAEELLERVKAVRSTDDVVIRAGNSYS